MHTFFLKFATFTTLRRGPPMPNSTCGSLAVPRAACRGGHLQPQGQPAALTAGGPASTTCCSEQACGGVPGPLVACGGRPRPRATRARHLRPCVAPGVTKGLHSQTVHTIDSDGRSGGSSQCSFKSDVERIWYHHPFYIIFNPEMVFRLNRCHISTGNLPHNGPEMA